MKKNLLFYWLLMAPVALLFAQPAEFSFTPNNASGGIIATGEINGIPASSNDWIAAFDQDGNCAGAVQLLDYGGQAFCNLQYYANDRTTEEIDEGIDTDDTLTFRLWVAATDEILDYPTNIPPITNASSVFGLSGSPLPGWGFADGKVINFSGPPLSDEDGDGLVAGLGDPDDTDPCNPNVYAATCDMEPPPGDGCTNAITYPGNVANGICVTNYDFSIFGGFGPSPLPTCDLGNNASAWFSWTAPITTTAGDPLLLSFNAGNCALGIEFFATDCSEVVSNCLDNYSSYITGIIQGNSYLIQIWDETAGSNNCDFCLSIGQPLGDECSDPIPYPGDVANGICVTNYDFSIFRDFGESPLPTCSGGLQSYAWFSWTAPITTAAGDSMLLNFNAGNCRLGIEFYSTDCLSAVSNCINYGNGIVTGIIQGNSYLIQIWDGSNGSTNCDFCLNIGPPQGDECSDPIPLQGDITIGICVTDFDISIFDDFGLSPPRTCDLGNDPTAWFSWTAPVTTATGDPLLLNFDIRRCNLGIEFYSTDCLGGAVSNCLSNESGIVTGIIQGDSYLIQIWDSNRGTSCDFCISLAPPQQPGDECSNPIPYPGDVANGVCVTDYDFSIFGVFGQSILPTCNFGYDASTWFSWTAPVTTAIGDPLLLNFDDGNCSLGIEFYSTDCLGAVSNCLADNNNNDGIVTGIIQGNSYLVQIWSSTSSTSCDFCLHIAPPQPPGDECFNPIPYPGDVANGICVTNYDFSIFGDLGQSPKPTCHYARNEDSYAWFSWTAPITTAIGDPLLLNFDDGNCRLGIEFYSTDCLGAVSNCFSLFRSGIVTGITQGESYLIQIWDGDAGDIDCDFCLSIASPPQPSGGDECSNPIPYPGDVVNGIYVTDYDFSIFGDLGQSPVPTCDNGFGSYGWFSWTAPVTTATGDPLLLNFNAGNCALGIEFYSTDCLVAVSNCLADLSNNSGVVTGIIQGNSYLIQIWDDAAGSTSCDFYLSIASPPQPSGGDECSDPIPYPGDVANGICVTGYDFSILGYSEQSPLPTCHFGWNDNSYAWFSWTAPVTTEGGDSLPLSFDNGNCSLGIEFYTTDCTGAVSNCLDNNSGIVTGIIQGNSYLIQIWDTAAGGVNCDFCLSIAPSQPPGDECSDPIPYPGDVANGICVTGYDFSIFGDSGQSPLPICDFWGGDSYVWFSWSAPVTTSAGDSLPLSFDAENCSLGIEFYSTDCLGRVSNCLNNNSGIVTGIIQGNSYLIQIWDDDVGSTSCDFCLSIGPTVYPSIGPPPEFNFTPNNHSVGIITTVEVDGEPASTNDWIAVFDEDGNCAGAAQLITYGGLTYCNLQVYGDDFTTTNIDEGINVGETFTFKLWVAATDEILDHPVDILPVTGWDFGLWGTALPGWDFYDNVVLNFVRSATNGDGDGDGFFVGMDDPDDTDPCNPDNSVAACDIDGDGISNANDPDDTDPCNPDMAACDMDGDGLTGMFDPDDTDLCNPNNILNLSITDSCNCIFGIDLNDDNIIDLSRETITIACADPPFTVSDSYGDFFDVASNRLTNTDLTNLINGSTLQFWVDAANSLFYTITIIDRIGTVRTISGGNCACSAFNPEVCTPPSVGSFNCE